MSLALPVSLPRQSATLRRGCRLLVGTRQRHTGRRDAYWSPLLLHDLAGDMVTPLVPMLVAKLGRGPAELGLIEGIADATSSLLKLVSGHLADRFVRSLRSCRARRALVRGG